MKSTVHKAQVYLESQLASVSSDPYALSIISFALVLAGSAKATSAVTMLNELAISKGDTDYFKTKLLIIK